MASGKKNGLNVNPPVDLKIIYGWEFDPKKSSPLGLRLRKISDKALAAGTARLTLDQIQRRIVDVRGG
jgi:hypothetical protein